MWVWIRYPFLNFNGCTIEVYTRVNYFIPHFTGHVIINPCWDLSLSMLVKEAQCHSQTQRKSLLHFAVTLYMQWHLVKNCLICEKVFDIFNSKRNSKQSCFLCGCGIMPADDIMLTGNWAIGQMQAELWLSSCSVYIWESFGENRAFCVRFRNV